MSLTGSDAVILLLCMVSAIGGFVAGVIAGRSMGKKIPNGKPISYKDIKRGEWHYVISVIHDQALIRSLHSFGESFWAILPLYQTADLRENDLIMVKEEKGQPAIVIKKENSFL